MNVASDEDSSFEVISTEEDTVEQILSSYQPFPNLKTSLSCSQISSFSNLCESICPDNNKCSVIIKQVEIDNDAPVIRSNGKIKNKNTFRKERIALKPEILRKIRCKAKKKAKQNFLNKQSTFYKAAYGEPHLKTNFEEKSEIINDKESVNQNIKELPELPDNETQVQECLQQQDKSPHNNIEKITTNNSVKDIIHEPEKANPHTESHNEEPFQFSETQSPEKKTTDVSLNNLLDDVIDHHVSQTRVINIANSQKLPTNPAKASSSIDNIKPKRTSIRNAVSVRNGIINNSSSSSLDLSSTAMTKAKFNTAVYNLESKYLGQVIKEDSVMCGRKQNSLTSIHPAGMWHMHDKIGLRTPLKSAKSSTGLLDWFKANQCFRCVYKKAKNSINTILVTLDPGMKDLYFAKKFKILVATNDKQETAAISDGFFRGFGDSPNLEINSANIDLPTIPSQPIGFVASLICAERKIECLKKFLPNSSHDILISISPLLIETTTLRWHGGYCILLNDPIRKLNLHVYTQLTPIPNDYVLESKAQTSKDYPYRHLGLSCTLGKALVKNAGKPPVDWSEMISGVSYYTLLENAAVTLAGMFECYVKDWSILK